MKIKFQPINMDFKFEISVLIYFFFVFIIYQLPSKIEPCIRHGNGLSFTAILNLAALPAYFTLGNLIFCFILKRKIILRTILAGSGIILGIGKFIQAPGIIDPVYFFIISTTCAGVIGGYKGTYLDEQVEKLNHVNKLDKATEKFIDYIRDGYKYILGKAFQGWLGLGASLGVSMSILFKSGYEDPHLKFMALKMLVGFILISFAVGYWVAIPMLNGIVSIQEILHSLKSKNET